MKHQINFRASDLASSQLDWLMAKWGTSQTETLTVIIDRVFQQEKNKMSIRTWQDSLGLWHAVINDAHDQPIAIIPEDGEYGFDTEASAITAGEGVAKEVAEIMDHM